MTEPVTPKADRRVLDGEVVSESAATQTDSAQANSAQTKRSGRAWREQGQTHRADREDTAPSVMRTRLKRALPWGVGIVAVMAVLFYTRPDQDWQIEHINRLQSQVAQLQQNQQQLNEQIAQQQQQLEQKLAEALAQPQQQPALSEADVEQLKQQFQQKLDTLSTELEARVQSLSEQAQQQWQTLTDQVREWMGAPSAEGTGESALQALEQKFQDQLAVMGDELARLLDFNASPPERSQETAFLDSYQIQQWRLEINTQWLLLGHIEQTQQQLDALEQALALSKVPNQTELARLIQADRGYLQQFAEQQRALKVTADQEMAALRALLATTTMDDSAEKEASAPEAAVEPSSTAAAWIERFKDLIRVQKRESDTSLTAVETLLLEEVLKQRLLLLLDRLQWALDTGTAAEAQVAMQAVVTFVEQHFKAQAAEFERRLAKLNLTPLGPRQPLAIAEAYGA